MISFYIAIAIIGIVTLCTKTNACNYLNKKPMTQQEVWDALEANDFCRKQEEERKKEKRFFKFKQDKEFEERYKSEKTLNFRDEHQKEMDDFNKKILDRLVAKSKESIY